MADFKILCPACTSVLSSKKPIPNGKRVTCPHCHKPFVAATSEAGSSADSGSLEFEFSTPAAASGSGSTKYEALRSNAKPSPSSAKSHAKPDSRRVVLWTAIIGFVVLAGAGGALCIYFLLAAETPVAQKNKTKKGGDTKADTKVVAAQTKLKNESRKEGKNAKGQEKASGGKNDGDKQPTQLVKGDAPVSAVPVVAAPVKRKVADWKEFKSAKGGYTVQFPARPDERMQRDDDIIYYETTSELNGFEYEITFHRLKKDELATPVKDRLDTIAAEFKDAYVTKPRECEFEGIPKTPVLELTLYKNDKKDVAVERWLVYKEHVFQICVCGDKEKLGPDQVSRFMQSFRFVADPQGGFLDLTQTTGIPPERKKK